MAQTPSNMIPLGTKAPDFHLVDARTGHFVARDDVRSDIATVILFICNHCPYVKHIAPTLSQVAKAYQAKGIQFVAINSNDVESYPQDGPEHMRIEAEKNGYTFPYLFDATQAVARAYQAACTPDFYVFDRNLACVYRGRFDAATPGNQVPVTGADLTAALDAILASTPVNPEQIPSVGCNIKWKKD